MWAIQIQFNGTWVTLQSGFATRDEAEWATAKWKQSNECYGDPFQAVQLTGTESQN